MFDVDSKDATVGMSCPPKPFVDPDFVKFMRDRRLTEQGIFVLNLVCRDPELRSAVIADVKNVFANVVSFKVPEEVNEIVYCTSGSAHAWATPENLKKGGKLSAQHPVVKALRATNDFVAKDSKFTNDDPLIDLSDVLKLLTVD